ncbi:hypothetical protein PYW08_012873 [Mythimna loreyi]|uniref:Uncharacterized protein n=1 Tax=Mythimna loreyi TaxID=667449 RepID=A0ACC2Q1C8_9NEOP|nr:hypothetical protein PYW08_012873 [Mythimna loreyi]
MASCTKFKRRDGTAGIRGHFYETKLISLIYFRAIHDDTIEEFQLASNVDNIGAFDDICFRAKVVGFDKPVSVFIQAKHKEKKNKVLTIDWSTYFTSYLNIRKQFDPSKEDWFYKSTFNEAECLFVIYTTAKDEFGNNCDIESSYSSIVDDLIDTGGNAKRPDQHDERVELLCEIAMREQMLHLAERIAQRIHDEINLDMLMSDEVVQRYHFILAQRVMHVSEIQSSGHRVATFRPDFFDTHEQYLTIFKDTLFKEILKRRQIDTDNIPQLLSEFLADPTDATKLSEVIGTVITYNKGDLEMNKLYTEYFTPHLKRVYVSQAIVEQAVELAAKQILLSAEFKIIVPSSFGNKDLTLSSNEKKKMKRINHLTSRLADLLDKFELSKTVIINESLEEGLLRLDGGLAGAIGNLFVLDDDNKLMKITDDYQSLGTDAKLLYERLNEEIKLINEEKKQRQEKEVDLCEYKFSFNVNKFPKVLLEYGDYEKKLAIDFLNKLIIYSNQADEKAVEKNLKDEIEESLTLSDSVYANFDDIFLKYHNEIQTWWLQPKEADYLTKNGELFKKATSYMIADPLMSSISVPYVRLMKQYNYTFTEDAVNSLNLQDQDLRTIIVAECSILTVAKVMQYLINKDYVALDIGHIVRLPTDLRNALRRELHFTNEEKVLIFVCDGTIDNKNKKAFKNIAEAVRANRTIIITNESSVVKVKRYFRTARVAYDQRNALIDMSEECRKRVFESAKVEFEDMKVELLPLLAPRRQG